MLMAISNVLRLFSPSNAAIMSSCLILCFNWFLSFISRFFMGIFIRFSNHFFTILSFFLSLSIRLIFSIFMIHWSCILFLFIFMILFVVYMNILFSNLFFGFNLFDISTFILIRSTEEARKSLNIVVISKKGKKY